MHDPDDDHRAATRLVARALGARGAAGPVVVATAGEQAIAVRVFVGRRVASLSGSPVGAVRFQGPERGPGDPALVHVHAHVHLFCLVPVDGSHDPHGWRFHVVRVADVAGNPVTTLTTVQRLGGDAVGLDGLAEGVRVAVAG